MLSTLDRLLLAFNALCVGGLVWFDASPAKAVLRAYGNSGLDFGWPTEMAIWKHGPPWAGAVVAVVTGAGAFASYRGVLLRGRVLLVIAGIFGAGAFASAWAFACAPCAAVCGGGGWTPPWPCSFVHPASC